MIDLSTVPDAVSLAVPARRTFELAAAKTKKLAKRWEGVSGAPVFTVEGKYTQRGWTEWTQGFQFGNALLTYEAFAEPWFLDYGRRKTIEVMAPHLSHTGVHDHGFNNISTYGNLLRMSAEGRIEAQSWEKEFYRLALKVSGAVQASRWTSLPGELGYIPSFNGAHSLFADTIRSLRVLAVSHKLGHVLMGEQDRKISLLKRLLQHAETTARWNVYLGKGRDRWDIRGRVAHESIFNLASGAYRCPSSQQGYSPFSTWTRGLAWIILGFAEELEFLASLPEAEFEDLGLPYFPDKASALERFEEIARATCDFYIENTPPDGIPYWDTGAPNLHRIERYLDRPADPFNPHESVDSSAAAIAAQGFLRLGRHLGAAKDGNPARQAAALSYEGAGRAIAAALMQEPYLSGDASHEGLLLHAVYHLPNGWDASSDGSGLPRGESCMWGDYHLLELALYLLRLSEGRAPQRFDLV
jgi:hypothetical protein